MSMKVRNAEEMLNSKGFLSPLFQSDDPKKVVTVKILTDDMLNSPDLQIPSADGGTEFVIKDYYQWNAGLYGIFSMALATGMVLTGFF